MRPDFEPKRVGEHSFDDGFEQILAEANESLSEVENNLISNIKDNGQPIVVICYSPRSGSTFLAQMLSRSRDFNYISNFIARFWEAPFFAGMLEKKLGFRERGTDDVIENRYGVTKNINDPHEFGFFWNKWFNFDSKTHRVKSIAKNKEGLFIQEIIALKSLYNLPLFIKNGVAGYNPSLFNELFNNVHFVVVKRDPLYIAQSIYKARLDLYDDPGTFWSLRPASFDVIKTLPPHEQIAHQIFHIYEDIYEDLEQFELRYTEIEYEKLVNQPAEELKKIEELLNITISSQFTDRLDTRKNANRIYLDDDIMDKLHRSVDNVFNGRVT